jgi:hypothetical protein
MCSVIRLIVQVRMLLIKHRTNDHDYAFYHLLWASGQQMTNGTCTMTKLTDLAIRNAISRLKSGEVQRIELKEGYERGAGRMTLILRTTNSGFSAEWHAAWSREGDRKMTKFGAYPETSLAKARVIYRQNYAPFILKGANPTGTRAWTKQMDGTLQGMGEAYLKYLEAKVAPQVLSGLHATV